ncbi:general transcription factor 3C polypeptide 6 [Rhinophrynus dorsalis]
MRMMETKWRSPAKCRTCCDIPSPSTFREQLVMVELTGIIDSDILEKCNNKCKIVGINTEKPFLQVDKYVFAGKYEDTLGTCVIFEETSGQGDGNSTKPQLKYKCHTMKKLNMTRTFLTEKKADDDGGDKVEWFQIKDGGSSSWPHMVCSFVQEDEEAEDAAEESHSEGEEREQLDGSTEDSGHLDQSFELEKQNVETEEKVDTGMENLDIRVEEIQDVEMEEMQGIENVGMVETQSVGIKGKQDIELEEKQDVGMKLMPDAEMEQIKDSRMEQMQVAGMAQMEDS